MAASSLGEPLMRGAAVDGHAAAAPSPLPHPADAEHSLTGLQQLQQALLDATFCVLAVGYALLPDAVANGLLGTIAVCVVGWRLRRHQLAGPSNFVLPYSCGVAEASGRTVFLVATVHISPKAPRDVRAVIAAVQPDVAMIELDLERRDRMTSPEALPGPRLEDMQPLRLFGLCAKDSAAAEACTDEATVLAQRAAWNGELAGKLLVGAIAFDEANPYGATPMSDKFRGKLALVLHGGPGVCPFAVKAYHAELGGAQAVLVVDSQPQLAAARLGTGGTIGSNLSIAWRTRNWGHPRLPVLLLPRDDGLHLLAGLRGKNNDLADAAASTGTPAVANGDGFLCRERVRGELCISEDTYPRRTLPRLLCQQCASCCSGIGVLYGVIQCFNVEVGAEFMAAEEQAKAQNIPCACIDVDMNSFWSRLAASVMPTPRNLLDAILSWMALPRLALQMLFPPLGNVDVFGATVLHVASFPIRTWIAFGLAAFCSSTVLNCLLTGATYASERGAEQAGAVSAKDRADIQPIITMVIYFYMLPQVYAAVVASRDEAMYRSIVAECRARDARRIAVVVGAGHANGILHRVRTRGL